MHHAIIIGIVRSLIVDVAMGQIQNVVFSYFFYHCMCVCVLYHEYDFNNNNTALASLSQQSL